VENAIKFRQKIAGGGSCLGMGVTVSDPTVTELLSQAGNDFVWIDMEHNPLTLDAVQAHIMATRTTDTAAIVRVGACDEALIKPVLDSGADGIIVPMVRTAEDAQRVVSLCRYPPEGTRGFGPRRPARYGRIGGPEFCRMANESVLAIVQIELIEAVGNLDAILETPGMDSIVIGACDLAGSMGLPGDCSHPDVLEVVDTVIRKARAANVIVGLATGQDPVVARSWLAKGVQWLTVGTDWSLLVQVVDQVLSEVRAGRS
jgi:2-dehydro-3-deoxyglucarate aldolase/4-hydroxy-2-oxoheptanedioate aldolase